MILVFIMTFCIIVALGFGAAAAWSDFNKLKIPNIYSVLIGASFIPAFIAVTIWGGDVEFFGSWKNHLTAFVLMFIITYLLFHFKFIGGGDSKLITVFALWTGITNLMSFLFIMTLIGAVLGGFTLLLNKKILFKNAKKDSWLALAQSGKKDLPYGIAIFFGALFAFWAAGYINPDNVIAFASQTIG